MVCSTTLVESPADVVNIRITLLTMFFNTTFPIPRLVHKCVPHKCIPDAAGWPGLADN
jgi:hypothetical protein